MQLFYLLQIQYRPRYTANENAGCLMTGQHKGNGGLLFSLYFPFSCCFFQNITQQHKIHVLVLIFIESPFKAPLLHEGCIFSCVTSVVSFIILMLNNRVAKLFFSVFLCSDSHSVWSPLHFVSSLYCFNWLLFLYFCVVKVLNTNVFIGTHFPHRL